MSTFNITRFGQALKCQFIVSRKDWYRVFAIYIIVLSFVNIFITRKAAFNGLSYDDALQKFGEATMASNYSMLLQSVVVFDVIFFCLAMLFGACLLFCHLKKTPQRSAYFLWPVSNLEKYIVCLVHNVLLVAVGTILSILIADAIRVLVDVMDGRVMMWSVSLVAEIFNVEKNLSLFLFSLFTVCLYIQSLFILGGSLFRKQHIILTSVSVMLYFVVLFKVVEWVVVWFGMEDKSISIVNNGEVTNALLYWSFIIGCWALVVIHYWLSYKFFTRMQVINNKWLNV
jgi:hypothetical protein